MLTQRQFDLYGQLDEAFAALFALCTEYSRELNRDEINAIGAANGVIMRRRAELARAFEAEMQRALCS